MKKCKNLGLSLLMVVSLLIILFPGCGSGGSGGGGGSTSAPPSTSATISGTQSIDFSVGSGQGNVGDNLSIPVILKNTSNARAVSCTINYNPTIVAPGDNGTGSIRDNGATVGSGIASRRKWSNGSVTLYLIRGSAGQTITMATIPFEIVGAGTTNLTINNVTTYDDCMQPVQAMTNKPTESAYKAPFKVGDLSFPGGDNYFGGGDNPIFANYIDQISRKVGLIRLQMGIEDFDNIGTDNPGYYDNLLDKMKERGCWALILVDPGTNGYYHDWPLDDLINAYSNACRNMALYYKNKGYNVIFELLNEPDAANYIFTDGVKVARLINAAATSIRSVWPNAKICTSGFAEINMGWINPMLENLDYSKINYIGYHAYNGQPTLPEIANGGNIDGKLAELRSKLNGHNVDVLMTEMSWAADEVGNENLRAAYYERCLLVHIRALVEGVVWHADTGTGPAASLSGHTFQIPLLAMQALPLIRDAFPGNPKDFGTTVPSDAPAVGVSVRITGACWSLGRSTTGLKSIALWLGPNQGNDNTADLVDIPANLKYAQVADLEHPTTGWVPKTVTIGATNQVLNIHVGRTPILIQLSDQPFGDLNNDGQKNEDDVDLVLQYLFGERPELDAMIKNLASQADLPSNLPDIRFALWLMDHMTRSARGGTIAQVTQTSLSLK